MVWKRECAKGLVDGVERYHRSVTVSEYLVLLSELSSLPQCTVQFFLA